MKLMNGRNYFNDENFNEMCEALEAGEHIEVYIDCIGHTRNNYYQEQYRRALVERFGDKLEVNCEEGAHSYSYNYKIKQ